MHYLVLQIIGFLLAATVSGIILGWWFKGIIVTLQYDQNKQRKQQKLNSVTAQLAELRGKYQHAQQQIEQYTEYFNGSTYSEYLDACEDLKQIQARNKDLSTQLAHYKQQVEQLKIQVQDKVGTLELFDEIEVTPAPNTTPTKAYYHDDLKKIKGITQEIEQQLNSLGILKYRQIAEFSLQDAEMIAKHLHKFELPDYHSMINTARNLYTELQHAA